MMIRPSLTDIMDGFVAPLLLAGLLTKACICSSMLTNTVRDTSGQAMNHASGSVGPRYNVDNYLSD